jgi:hypothetical protein
MHTTTRTRTHTVTTTTTEVISISQLTKSEHSILHNAPSPGLNPEQALIRKITEYARRYGCTEAEATHAILHPGTSF